MVAQSPEAFPRVLDDYVGALTSGESRDDDLSPRDPWGDRRYYHRRLLPMGDCVVVTYRDTTDRVNEMKALEAGEREKNAILDGLSDLICVSEPDDTGEFVITYANRAYLDFMGLSGAQVIGKPRTNFQPPALYEMYEDVRRSAIAARGPVSRELTGVLNGERRHANVLVLPFFNSAGDCIRTIWRITDLSEQRAAEAERDAVSAIQGAVLDGLSDFVYMLERDEHGEFRITYANENAVRRFHRADGVIGKRIEDVSEGADDEQGRLALLHRCLETAQPAEARFKTRPGDRDLALETRAMPLVDPDGNIRRVIWRSTDITDRDLSGRHFEALATANLDPFSILEPVYDAGGEIVDFRFRYSNPAGRLLNRAYSGIDEPELLSEIFAAVPVAFADELARYVRVVTTGEPFEHSMQTRARDGSFHWLFRQMIPVDGGIVITGRDKTAEHEAIEELGRASVLLREALDGLSDSIAVADRQPDGQYRVVVANETFASELGRASRDLVGLNLDDLLNPDHAAEIHALLADATSRGLPAEREIAYTVAGRQIIRLTRVIPVLDADGTCIRTIWRATDVTALHATQSRFQAAADTSLDTFMILEPVSDGDAIVDMRITFRNERAAKRVAGYSNGQPQTLRDLLPNDPATFRETLGTYTRVLETRTAVSDDIVRKVNDDMRSFDRHILPLDGAVAVSYRDTTEERRRKQALEDAERNQRAILDGLSDAVVVADRDAGDSFPVTYANRAFFAMLDLQPEEVYGRRPGDFLDPDKTAVANDTFARITERKEPLTAELKTTVNGRTLTVSAHVTPILDAAGDVMRVIWRLTDISGQRAVEGRFLAAAEANLDSFMIVEPVHDESGEVVDFDLVYANAAARSRFARYNEDGHAGRLSDLFALAPDRFAPTLKLYREAMDGMVPVEQEIRSEPQGESFWYRRQLMPFDGGLVVTYREISDERRAQLDLVASERNQRAILDGLSDAVVVSDRDAAGDYPVTYANPAFFKLLGISPDEIVTKGVAEFLPREIAEAVYRTRFEAIEAAQTIERVIGGEVRGKMLDLEASISPVFDEAGVCTRLIWRLNDLGGIRKERAQAQAAERDLRAILENLTDGIVVTDRDPAGEFRLSFVHPVPAMAGRMNFDLMIGKSWAELLSASEAEERAAVTARVLAELAPVDFDSTLPLEGGDILHFAGRASPVMSAGGRCDRIVWRYSDVTDAYRHQREIAAAEANQRAILEGLTDGIVVTDRGDDGEFWITYAHPLLATADVFAPERLIGKRYADLTDLIGEDQLAVRAEAQERAIETKAPVDFETWVTASDGRRIHESALVTPVFDEKGQCTRLIWRYADVTQTERDELRLRQADRNYRGIIETIDDGLLVFDRDGTGTFRVTFSRPLAVLQDWLGDVMGKAPEEFWEGEVLTARLEYIREAIEQRKPIDFETFVIPTGNEPVYELARVTPVFNDTGSCTRLVWRFTDVTAMYAARRELETVEREQRAILNGISDYIFMLDRDDAGDFRVSYANEAAQGGQQAAVAIGKRFDEFLQPDDAAVRMDLVGRVATSGRPEGTELSYVEDGAERWLSINASPVMAADGVCHRIVWRVSDVTALREQQARIEANERFQDAILSALRDFIYVFDRDADGEFRYSYLNRAARLLNQRRDRFGDPIGLRVDDVMEPEEAITRSRMFEQAIRTRSSVSGELNRQMRDGTMGYASAVVTPVFEPDGTCNRLILRATDTTATRTHRSRSKRTSETGAPSSTR